MSLGFKFQMYMLFLLNLNTRLWLRKRARKKKLLPIDGELLMAG